MKSVGVAQDDSMHLSPSLWLFVYFDPVTCLILLLGSSKIKQFFGHIYLHIYLAMVVAFYLISCYNITNLNTNTILKGVLKY
ncbi:hypothetical protein HanRHA438_Chr06g0271661 [Helianthus annuus]|nr:hypothetical protein HanRHA438_Chr06g0271661 [Helianthus annuus]